MRRRTRLIGAVVWAAVVGLCFVLYARQLRAEQDSMRKELMSKYGGEVVSVVCAKTALEAGDVVDGTTCEVVSWVSDLLPQDAILSLEEVSGKAITVPLAKGAPLSALNIREDKTSLDVPDGYVAVSVPTSDKWALPADVGGGTDAVAYVLGETEARLLTSEVKILKSSGRSSILAIRPQDVPALLEAVSKAQLRVVIPASDVVNLADINEKQPPKSVQKEEQDE